MKNYGTVATVKRAGAKAGVGSVTKLSIEPAKNGFTLEVRRKRSLAEQKAMMYDMDSSSEEEMVFTDVESMLSEIRRCLGAKAPSKKK